ncbi:zinc finger protein 142-like isoform X1 [Euwallacea fornicatus]|uniref:zinc finger protein 142-like isoform X1 n=1 Tax=Euwallacea fornicatus TaxID=995702 RepID=UPI0033902F56
MSVPSMVHRSDGGNLAVRNVVSGDAFHEQAADVADADEDVDERAAAAANDDRSKELPDCKVRRNYTCSSCNFFTQNPRLYLYHLRDDHNQRIKVYECPSCLYASKHFQKLLRHSKMVHGSSEGVSTTSTAETSRKSRRRSASDVGDDCEEAQQFVQEEDDGIDEMLLEDPDTPVLYKCSLCDFTSRNRMQLNKHEREEHIKTKFFRCSKCTYVTHIKARYTKHVKYHSMPMIKCDMCDFRTPYKWNLDRHCKNHNGKGAFRCSACNFTADIKQSLTVHEMNHHVPPVGQAAGLGVGRRRNKVGASDTTAAEEAAANQDSVQIAQQPEDSPVAELADEPPKTKAKFKITPKKSKVSTSTSTNVVIRESPQGKLSDFIHPDDIIQHSNGKVYIKNKCKLCNFKTAWDSEMAKHEKHFHNIGRDLNGDKIKKTARPVPNLIPIPFQSKRFVDAEPMMSQTDINEICRRSGNSALKDFASLFGSEDVFKNPSTSKVPDLIPTSIFAAKGSVDFKQKNASFFDHLKEKLELGSGCNLVCNKCGYESKCLTEQAKHKKICGKEVNSRVPNIIPVHNISASRCQYCRQRCKSSADLYNHLQTCAEAIKFHTEDIKQEDDLSEHELKIDEDRQSLEEEFENKPHPMENKVFVWNDIMVPMDIDVDDSNYEYTEDRVDDNVSLDLSIRTQSPANSESSYLGQENNNSISTNNNLSTSNVRQSPVQTATTTEKIPTHGNDISVAQHKRVFKCPHCTFWASTASRFHVHIVGHLNKKPFECSLCSYRSNWRWDITKHIKLKSVRDQAHESAKVLMTDETGRRNYTKYNKYLTEIPLSSLQGSNETSGGSGTRPKNSSASTSKSEKTGRYPASGDFNSLLKITGIRTSPGAKATEKQLLSNVTQEKKSKANSDSKRTLFKCKKCNFRDASRDVLLDHVKSHYQQQDLDHQQQELLHQAVAAAQVTVTPTPLSLGTGPPAGGLFSTQDLSLRGTSPDRDEASVNNSPATKGGSGTNAAPFRCGHCNQTSNWKHVIQRHCRLKHSGDIRVVSTKNGLEKIEIDEQLDEPDDIEFKCNLCPYNTDNHDKFQRHLEGHLQEPDSAFTCTFCKFGVSEEKEFSEHLRLHTLSSADSDYKKFRCALCPYETNSKSQYTYHKQFHKDRGGQYTCSQCSYNVSKRHLLHQHLKVHGINVPSSKPSADVVEGEETSDADEGSLNKSNMDSAHFADIPLVWVSKLGKFSKMFKCRYCPHVNLRKVNIHEHEKMHSMREKNASSTKSNDMEHRCTECNYVCNNAGVLSSHTKVHQGLYGIVHCLVDPSKSDDEQIRELTRALGPVLDGIDTSEFLEVEMEEVDSLENMLYFCKDCPARFLKENEFNIHGDFHSKDLEFKCKHCSYSADSEQHLNPHMLTHSHEYQERTKALKSVHVESAHHPEPNLKQTSDSEEDIWVVDKTGKSDLEQKNNILASFLSKPLKSCQTVPLSGTDLFLQRSEAQQRQSYLQTETIQNSSMVRTKSPDPQFGEQMHGNPDFIYQTYIKNGRTKEKRYKCHKCPSAFEKRDQYKIHLGLHGSKQKYNCECCDYSVKYYANYVQHQKKHKFNEDAQAAKRLSEELSEDMETNAADEGPEGGSLQVSVADQQMADILQMRKDEEASSEEKKTHWCSYCPYISARKDSLDNHLKRHECISGIKNTYTCEHCDYSVPQAHVRKDHEKLHFIPNKANHVNGYMICDNLKLTASNLEASSDEDVIYDESDKESKEDDGKFNNNKGENREENVQTGELSIKDDVSDVSVEKSNNSVMEVN